MTKYTPHDAPPQVHRGRPRSLFPDDLLDACRENPGMWFCVEGIGNRASATYWGRRWPDFEIVTRKQGDRLDAWITYTGGNR